MKIGREVYIGIITLAVLLFASLFFGLGSSTAAVLSLAAFALLYSLPAYLSRRKVRVVEARLPDFLLDVVGAMNSGMALPLAFKSVSMHNYGPLGSYVKKMAAQIDWGVPLNKTLEGFSASLDSKVVRIAINTILEAQKAGGNIAEILKATAASVSEIERLRKERTSRIYTQLVNGYIIFFTFLVVMIVLQGMVFPSLISIQGAVGSGGPGFYAGLFTNLIIIQGFFSGIAIGKMSEGSVSAGLRHAAIFIVVGLLAFSFFT